jgi:MFS transporter, Spinster family, sphingosine-1-phosphate transporter
MPPDESRSARRAAAYALAVLTFINLFNYMDRWVISAVLESIKKSELHPTDTQLGSLVSGFIIVYMLASPIFGSLGDRKKRPPLIAAGVVVWSVATALAGFARSFAALFTARATVGVGEAAYGTIAPALLADHFPIERRGRVFAVFFAAIPVGSAAGYIVGGLVDQHFGWRAAFWVAGLPGIVLALLILGVREVPRGQHDSMPHAAPRTSTPVGAYLHLLRNTQYMLAVLGYAAYTFALGGLGAWTAVFLERVRGMSRHEATVTFGTIVLVTGFLGTFMGGWLGDLLLRRTKQSYLWVCGVTTLLAAPVALVAFTHPVKQVYFTAMVIAEILVFASTGPVNSAIVNLVAPGERASAVALSIFFMHLLGDVPSPPLMGAISEASSIARAFLVVPVALLVSGLIWSFAAWRGARVDAS